MRFEISFRNASPKLATQVAPRWRVGTYYPRWVVPTAQHAEEVITEGLRFAQTASVTVWPQRGGYVCGRTNRQRWHGKLEEILPKALPSGVLKP